VLGCPQRDEGGQADIDAAGIEQRHARLDDPLILQPLDAAPAGIARQPDAFAEIVERRGGVPLQDVEQLFDPLCPLSQ
jgi:hypothetical protein